MSDDRTTDLYRQMIIGGFVHGGESVEFIAERTGKSREEVEAILRADMKWLYETDALATQMPGNLSAALDEQAADAVHAADVGDWHRGYRAGYAVAKQSDASAVGHMGNAILARAAG